MRIPALRSASPRRAGPLETLPANGPKTSAGCVALAEAGARIQVAEQYAYQPHHAARLACVASGRLGASQVQVSAAHTTTGLACCAGSSGCAADGPDHGAAVLRPGGRLPGRGGRPPRSASRRASDHRLAHFGDRLGCTIDGSRYFVGAGAALLVRGERANHRRTGPLLLSYREPMRRRSSGWWPGRTATWRAVPRGSRWRASGCTATCSHRPPHRRGDRRRRRAGRDGPLRPGRARRLLAEACQDRYLISS